MDYVLIGSTSHVLVLTETIKTVVFGLSLDRAVLIGVDTARQVLEGLEEYCCEGFWQSAASRRQITV